MSLWGRLMPPSTQGDGTFLWAQSAIEFYEKFINAPSRVFEVRETRFHNTTKGHRSSDPVC